MKKIFNQITRKHNLERSEIIKKLLGNVKNKSIMDVGCAIELNFANYIADRYGKYTGTDIDPSIIQKNELINRDNVEFIILDANHKPPQILNGKYDVLLATTIVESGLDPRKRAHRTNRRKKPQPFTKLHVDALEPSPHRCRDRTLERHPVSSHRRHGPFRQGIPVFFEGGRSRRQAPS